MTPEQLNLTRFVYTVLPRLVDCVSQVTLINIRYINKTWMYLFRTLSVGRITDRYESRVNKLKAFSAYLNYLPAQGSAEWLAQRAGTSKDYIHELLINIHALDSEYKFPPTIGGSELDSLIIKSNSRDTKQTPCQLMRRKLGIDCFNGSIDTNWGKMFEAVINSWTEHVFNTELIETGSVPGLRNKYGIPIQSYSPDGVSIVSMKKLRDVIERENHKATTSDEWIAMSKEADQDCRMVLFEFKCPFRRKPNGIVPPQYKAQPRVGMVSLEIPEISMFIDAGFRKCRITDFNFGIAYDNCFPPARVDQRYIETPKALGFIGIYEYNARGKLGKQSASIDDLRKIHKIIRCMINSLDKKYINIQKSIYLTAVKACDYYSSVVDGQFANYEFTVDNRFQIMWNVMRDSEPELAAMQKPECLLKIKSLLRLLEVAQEHYDFNDLNFGLDLGNTRNIGEMKDINKFEVLTIEQLQLIIADGRLMQSEEIYSIIHHANEGKDFKLYYPDKFCYQPCNPYAEELSSNNDMDVNLSSEKQCKKWLWTNVKEFEKFY